MPSAAASLPFDSAFSRVVYGIHPMVFLLNLGPGLPGTRERAEVKGVRLDTERNAMRRKRFILSLLADAIFLLGLAAIVVGIAMAGHVPLAVGVAGAEMIVLSLVISPGQKEGDGG